MKRHPFYMKQIRDMGDRTPCRLLSQAVNPPISQDSLHSGKSPRPLHLCRASLTDQGTGLTRISLFATVFALILMATFSGCTLPRIIIHEDPLSAEEHNNLGIAYESEGQYDAASKEYEKALKKRSGWTIPLFNLGNIAYRRGDRKGAEAFYRKAIAAEPKNAAAWNNLAQLLLEENRREEALRAAQRAVSLEDREAYQNTLREIESTGGSMQEP